jgi:hypothetical protein
MVDAIGSYFYIPTCCNSLLRQSLRLYSVSQFTFFLSVSVSVLISLTGVRSISHDCSVDDSPQSLIRQLHLLQWIEKGAVFYTVLHIVAR